MKKIALESHLTDAVKNESAIHNQKSRMQWQKDDDNGEEKLLMRKGKNGFIYNEVKQTAALMHGKQLPIVTQAQSAMSATAVPYGNRTQVPLKKLHTFTTSATSHDSRPLLLLSKLALPPASVVLAATASVPSAAAASVPAAPLPLLFWVASCTVGCPVLVNNVPLFLSSSNFPLPHKCLRQTNSVDCRYYVMKFMKDIITHQQLVIPTKYFEDCQFVSYNEEQLREVKDEWAAYVFYNCF
ncbi:uncharacterized protein LOC130712814 [Lotus japonicus]|uniref:uncharacterized protein LOC130712814 n=1 Tax=Lotus japonicus TaxID=34305 RepID=UPI002583E70A|nr:uncharacterized protein LOC130712814 [Lotus japonicus]